MPGIETFEALAEEKRERILDASLAEFADHGFTGASANRIVAAAGISKGALFKYFGAKEGLFGYVFRRAADLFKEALAPAGGGGDFFDRVEKSLLAGVDFINAHPRIYRMYLKALFHEDAPFRERFLREVRLYSAKYLRPLVEEGLASGRVRPGIDPDFVVFFLDAVMDRFLQALAVPSMDGGAGLYGADRETIRRRVSEVADYLRRGLGTGEERC